MEGYYCLRTAIFAVEERGLGSWIWKLAGMCKSRESMERAPPDTPFGDDRLATTRHGSRPINPITFVIFARRTALKLRTK